MRFISFIMYNNCRHLHGSWGSPKVPQHTSFSNFFLPLIINFHQFSKEFHPTLRARKIGQSLKLRNFRGCVMRVRKQKAWKFTSSSTIHHDLNAFRSLALLHPLKSPLKRDLIKQTSYHYFLSEFPLWHALNVPFFVYILY